MENEIQDFLFPKTDEKSVFKRYYLSWFRRLFNVCVQRFKYENLPANLPQYEIEKRLILRGFIFVFKNKTYGIVTSDGGLSGVNIYNMPNKFNYAQPVLGSNPTKMVNLENGVIGYASSADKMGFGGGFCGERIRYYSEMLANVDISKRVYLINSRAINSITAKSDNALKELREFYRRLERGDLYVPKITSGVLDSTENIIKNVQGTGNISINDFDLTTQNILKNFYAENGIIFGLEKRERMLTDEITAEEDAQNINIADELACREELIQNVNFLFGTKIIVEVNNDVIT